MAKRWEQQVVKAGCYNDVTGPYTVKLLARQHAAFVRMVTQQHANCNNPCACCCDALLAALAKQRKK